DKNSPVESKMFSRFVAGAQKRIEGNNFESRKNVLKYDDVLRMHREIIYKERMDVLTESNIEEQALNMLFRSIEDDASMYIDQSGRKTVIDYEGLYKHFNGPIYRTNTIDLETLKEKDEEGVIEYLKELANFEINNKKTQIPEEVFVEFLKVIMLRII